MCLRCVREGGGTRHQVPNRRGQGRTSRSDWLRWKYDLTIDQYEELLAGQGGKCAICKTTPEKNGNNLSVDHDHATGMVRGLLCKVCNRDVGRLEKYLDETLSYLGIT